MAYYGSGGTEQQMKASPGWGKYKVPCGAPKNSVKELLNAEFLVGDEYYIWSDDSCTGDDLTLTKYNAQNHHGWSVTPTWGSDGKVAKAETEDGMKFQFAWASSGALESAAVSWGDEPASGELAALKPLPANSLPDDLKDIANEAQNKCK